MKPNKRPIILMTLLVASVSLALLAASDSRAQNSAPASSAAPSLPPPVPESQPPAAAPQSSPAASPAAPAGQSTPTPKNKIRLNFQNASLADVLNYLSEAAGFVIVEDVPISGTVNVVSRQPVDAEEAVDLLNTVLVDKGYIAVRNGRILKIVNSKDAQKNDLPVEVGSDPENIPRKDGMVTQILPIKYMDAGKLVENLSPLLSANATIGSNASSNAIILTDTQTNIHRVAEIIHSLDTSISSISTIHVFPLRYADAKDFANVLTQLFAPDQGAAGGRNGQNNGNIPAFLARFARGMGGGGGGEPAAEDSEARKAASRVVAVADEQSNSVVVSAPEEYMPTITEIVNRLDTSPTDVTETRIFNLQHADCGELTNILNTLYGDATTVSGANDKPGQNAQRPPPANNNKGTERQLQQARMVAVADQRTNSILVNCSHDTMEQVALTIGRLDATDIRQQHVYVHTLERADPDNVATILRGMFGDTNASNTAASQPSSDGLNQRTTVGASSSVTSTLSTNGGNSGGGGNGSR